MNTTKENQIVKYALELLFVNMAHKNQYVKFVWGLRFANIANVSRDVRFVVELLYVKPQHVKQQVLKNIMAIAYLVVFKYAPKFKYHATIKLKKEMLWTE